MHDINPLGTTMHLRELDRRAAPRLVPVAAEAASAPKAGSIVLKAIQRLRQLYVPANLGRPVVEG